MESNGASTFTINTNLMMWAQHFNLHNKDVSNSIAAQHNLNRCHWKQYIKKMNRIHVCANPNLMHIHNECMFSWPFSVPPQMGSAETRSGVPPHWPQRSENAEQRDENLTYRLKESITEPWTGGWNEQTAEQTVESTQRPKWGRAVRQTVGTVLKWPKEKPERTFFSNIRAREPY